MLWLLFLLLAGCALVICPRLRPTPRRLCLAAAAAALLGFAASTGSYELRKLVGVALMPAGLLWLAGAGLLLAAASRGGCSRRCRLVALMLWLGYSAAGNPWLSRELMGLWEGPYSHIDPMQVEGLDAVLVLGGGVVRHDWGQTFAGCAGDRVLLGARMQLAGRCERLLSSGPPWPPQQPDTSIPKLTAGLWRELGVGEEKIILLEGPRTTSEEINALTELLARHRWQRVGLVSSAFHLRRAMGLAERHGLELIPLPADFRSTRVPLRPRDLVPQGQAFADLSTISWELLGIAAGR